MTTRSGAPEPCVVVGAGVVGLAKGRALTAHGHRVAYVDSSDERCHALEALGVDCRTAFEPRRESTIYFVCVPTPSTPDGFDFAILRDALSALGSTFSADGPRHLVVVCSTVPPGCTSDVVITTLEHASGLVHGTSFDVAAMPEFLRAQHAERDALEPWITVIGAPDASVRERLRALFGPFGGELRASTSFEVAELVKVTHNAYNAAKISFFNEMFLIGQALGIDANEVSEIVSLSAEASRNRAYGIRGGAPFEGDCLPKDLDGLIAFAASHGVRTPVLRATREVNHSMRTPPSHDA